MVDGALKRAPWFLVGCFVAATSGLGALVLVSRCVSPPQTQGMSDAFINLHDRIELGMTPERASGEIDKTTWPAEERRPYISRDGDRSWTVKAPPAGFASNWILFVDFHDSRVVAVRTGTEDDARTHPPGARPDKAL